MTLPRPCEPEAMVVFPVLDMIAVLVTVRVLVRRGHTFILIQ
jgi:hypothetical protein